MFTVIRLKVGGKVKKGEKSQYIYIYIVLEHDMNDFRHRIFLLALFQGTLL